MGESPENIYHANNWIIIWCGPLADWPTSLALCYLVTSVTTTTPSLVSLIYFLTSGIGWWIMMTNWGAWCMGLANQDQV